ncbi:hypothetical protein CCO03_15050 [Comamonas serinivorans]|uniref:DUF2726 domain-containing protein n=1 Tax=Comamonas serinivorans TaxID=1082851 RepID=A0A1Y0EQ82_9BURK|nr:hypothetical protein CCO03_15050 [Comamonas serinivorans]
MAMLLGVAGLAAGAALNHVLARKRQARETPDTPSAPSLPEHWPLQPRAVVSHNESIIWRWLRASFPQHRVLVKLPFSRFTSPTDVQVARTHYHVLNGLYATFTIADRNGQVHGCIDLVGNNQAMSSAQHVKQGILADLGIAYEIIQGTALPSAAAIRVAILNHQDSDEADVTQRAPLQDEAEHQLQDARSHLLRLLDRQRDRRADFRPSELGDLSDLKDQDPPTSVWQQP